MHFCDIILFENTSGSTCGDTNNAEHNNKLFEYKRLILWQQWDDHRAHADTNTEHAVIQHPCSDDNDHIQANAASEQSF